METTSSSMPLPSVPRAGSAAASASPRRQYAELAALRIGEHGPTHVALPDVGPRGQLPEPGKRGRSRATELALELYAVASTERSVCLAPRPRNRDRSSSARAAMDRSSTLNRPPASRPAHSATRRNPRAPSSVRHKRPPTRRRRLPRRRPPALHRSSRAAACPDATSTLRLTDPTTPLAAKTAPVNRSLVHYRKPLRIHAELSVA
jgi:hypothetical protein